MSIRRLALGIALALAVPLSAGAQDTADPEPTLFLELNALQDVESACRLSFLVRNETGAAIDQAVFETVIFDAAGGVVSLSLFDFRDLPADRPRVRQFDLQGMVCADVGRALINGANTCLVDGAESEVCHKALTLDSRLSVELLG